VNGTEIATGVNPTVVLLVGSTTVVLTVTDDDEATDTDSVMITVNSPDNLAPIAHAGPDQTIMHTDNDDEEEVTLNGSGSTDPDGEILTYSWSVNGNEIATGVNPTVVLPVGSTTVELTVTDDDGATDTDSVVIMINSPDNVAPVADAGPHQTLTDTDDDGEEEVTLDGSGSTDSNGEIVTYSWLVNGNEIATGVNPTVVLPVGSTTVVLTVTDDDGATDTDSVVIMINSTGNMAPRADAGPNQTITDTNDGDDAAITLDGSASTDPDGEIVAYSWSVNEPVIAAGVNPTVVLPIGSTTVELTVTDDDGATDTDSVVIMINSPDNVAPVADAGPDQTIMDTDADGEEEVTLDGSGSTDSGGEIVTY